MSQFDAADEMASQAVGVLLNEPVIWRPMRMSRDTTYTGMDRAPDVTRPVRGLDDPLLAIVTWKASTMQVGQGMDTPTGVVVADCVVDFDNVVFRNFDGSWSFPQKGDLFELMEELPGPSRFVQVEQRGDDGAVRVLFFCSPYS